MPATAWQKETIPRRPLLALYKSLDWYHLRYHTLSQREKLLDQICSNSKDVRFGDACKAAEAIGFSGSGGQGSHHAYQRPGEPVGLNFQKNKDGKIPPYQGKQLAAMIRRYRDGDDGA